MKLLLVKVATITIIIELQFCTAQLFPWSNIKHYFDQKTKHGPGSGGILNISPDLDDPNNDKTSSGDRPYRNTDSDTYFIRNKSNKDKNLFTEQFGTTTSKDITKQILKINKNKVHLNFDNTQNHRSNDEEIHKVNRYENNFTPVLSINHDSTIKPLHKPMKEQNINIELLNNNKNILTEDNYESQTQNTIVITQKPIVVSPNNDYNNNRTQNYNKISHKTVSIIPSVNIKTLSFNDQPIYVTTRPQNFPITSTHRTKIIDLPSSSTHRPLRPTTSLFRPRPQYYNIQNSNYNKNTPIFLPTTQPPTITTVLTPKIINLQPSQSPNVRYFDKNNEESYVEMVPSLGIEIKTSNNNKPFRITDRGVVDYLVPPPPPSSLPQQSEPKLSVYGTKQYKRKPYSLIKDDAIEKNNNNNEGELKLYNVIPEKTEQQFNRNNKKTKHYLNSIKQQQRSQKEENDDSLIKEDTKNLQTEQRSRIKRPQQLTMNQYKRNKYSNHKISSSDTQITNNNENHHTAASDINEQITSETGFSGQPQTDGQRVEFQMHGQNGPKSYKFGFDTGKGHNRQFRYEERDKDGHVKGHYGYYDKEGKLQVVNYEADPHTGFKAEPA
ncbi:uncharacterized protein LOC142330981 [Lycorma delicatula]|uniref:uncharacterized protein LOC142330981 n=1 Tax=Lycorma delicatula TaxID=130591 RepID=UPI003F514236